MKLLIASALFSMAAVSNAALEVAPVVLDEPVIFVRAGEQDNGVSKVDALITNVTQGLGGSPVSGPIGSSRSFQPSPGSAGGVPSAQAFALPPSGEVTLPLPPKPVTPVTPVTPPVPEPETYALMTLGLAGLYLSKKKKA